MEQTISKCDGNVRDLPTGDYTVILISQTNNLCKSKLKNEFNVQNDIFLP